MEEWQQVCNILRNESNLEKNREFLAKNFEKYQIYADSLIAEGGSFFVWPLSKTKNSWSFLGKVPFIQNSTGMKLLGMAGEK